MAFPEKIAIQFTTPAEKELRKLDIQVQKYLIKKLVELEGKPQLLENAVHLSGTKDKYRLRFGDYRVIYAKEKDGTLVILVILKVGHRKDVYDGL